MLTDVFNLIFLLFLKFTKEITMFSPVSHLLYTISLLGLFKIRSFRAGNVL